MTPEETAKLIVEEFNGHTFFMESMAQEWLEKRIAEGINKHIEAANQAPAEPHPNPVGELRPEDHPDALKEAVEKVSALVKKPKPRQKRSGPNWG